MFAIVTPDLNLDSAIHLKEDGINMYYLLREKILDKKTPLYGFVLVSLKKEKRGLVFKFSVENKVKKLFQLTLKKSFSLEWLWFKFDIYHIYSDVIDSVYRDWVQEVNIRMNFKNGL